MFQPKVVLAPTDFSDSASEAVETAAAIASRQEATLILVHVVAMLPKLPNPLSIALFHEGQYERTLQEHATRQIGDLSAKYARDGLTVESEIGIANDVAGEILRIAERRKTDLIVIATHGMTGWNAFVFGSVAEKVVRSAPGAVLVLKAPPESKRGPS